MKTKISSRNDIRLINSSSFDNNEIEIEVWHKGVSLFAVSIDENYDLGIFFGKLNKNSIKFQFFLEILEEIKMELEKRMRDWKSNFPNA